MKELMAIGQEVEDHRQNKNTVKSESRVFSWVIKIFIMLVHINEADRKESYLRWKPMRSN